MTLGFSGISVTRRNAAAVEATTTRKDLSLLGTCAAAAVFLGILAAGSGAKAAFVISFSEVGADVVGTGSGTINTSALTASSTNVFTSAQLFAATARGYLGPTSAAIDVLTGASGPTSFGTGANTVGSSGSGDLVGIIGALGYVLVPHSYVSGTALADSATWSGASYASLGMTPGTYTWNWGSGGTADSFTVQINGVVATPEPASFGVLGLGLAALGVVRRRRAA